MKELKATSVLSSGCLVCVVRQERIWLSFASIYLSADRPLLVMATQLKMEAWHCFHQTGLLVWVKWLLIMLLLEWVAWGCYCRLTNCSGEWNTLYCCEGRVGWKIILSLNDYGGCENIHLVEDDFTIVLSTSFGAIFGSGSQVILEVSVKCHMVASGEVNAMLLLKGWRKPLVNRDRV